MVPEYIAIKKLTYPSGIFKGNSLSVPFEYLKQNVSRWNKVMKHQHRQSYIAKQNNKTEVMNIF